MRRTAPQEREPAPRTGSSTRPASACRCGARVPGAPSAQGCNRGPLRARALFALGLALAPPQSGGPVPTVGAPPDPYDHVLVVGVDGLRSDALLLDGVDFPALDRLCGQAVTWNARTDPDWTVTLPNFTGVLTGRLVEGPKGHGWRENRTPHPGRRLVGPDGEPVPGLFHVSAAAGVAGYLGAGKDKFVLFDRSWNDDAERFTYVRHRDAADGVRHLLAWWDSDPAPRTVAFLHLAECDAAGHAEGWDLTPGSAYLEAVATVDAQLERVLAWLDEHPERRARTAVVLTADHGGGVPLENHHGLGHLWTNYVIPFALWTGDARWTGPLYDLAGDARRDPGLWDPRPDAEAPPPIRNAEAANLALALLGLPPVPGSTVGAHRPLLAVPTAATR